MTPTVVRCCLRVLYPINAAAAAAAVVVLAFTPGAILAAVGLTITPAANLLAYLLAAAELAIATLCGLTARSSQRETEIQTVVVVVIFHVASAAAGLTVVWTGEDALILWNVAARAVVVAALLGCARIALRR